MPRLACLTAQIRAAYLGASGATLLSALLLPLPAQAAPVDPVVRAGTATFAINGNVYTVTNAPNTIIDWRSFNVASGELLRFLQQHPQSVVLNRVTGNDPSQLFGLLQSNGRVVLVNPNGILFGPNAQTDVAGLIASTLNLSDADFLAGRMAFNGGGAALNNQGRITTPLGGSVFLVGGDVTNSGVITAPGGRILLAAGQSVQLADSGTPGLSVTLKADGRQALNLGELTAQGGSIDIYGALVNHQGLARADSAVLDARGNIVLKASGDATVSGTLSAANAAGTGGTVQVLGDSVTLSGAARIDASGREGGGTVLVGGDFKGANPAVSNARTATVAAGARIDASATGNGDGGKVVVWSNDKTDYAGSILARGGALGGNGGQVETSGKLLSFDQGRVNTLAPKGVTGHWLLDPAVFCFYHTSASECTGAAAAGATDFNTLGNILVGSGGILEATDFITFLPAGGNAAVSNSIPSGLTLNVKAPYIQLGNGSNIDTRVVGVRLDASNAYGNTTQTGAAGVNLTGTIDVGGILTSDASQTVLASASINIGAGANSVIGLNMTAAGGTQTLTASDALYLVAGADKDINGNLRNATLHSAGAQLINTGKVILAGGNSAGAANTFAEISAKGNQSITADEVTLGGGLSGYAAITVGENGATQTINASTLTLAGGSGASDNYASLYSAGNQAINAKALAIRGGINGKNNWANISINGGADATQTINAGTITMDGGASGTLNYAGIHAEGTRVNQGVTADSLVSKGGGGTQDTWAHLWAFDSVSANKAKQTITIKLITLTGGSGADSADAIIGGNGTQTVRADNVTVTGGTGNRTGANIGTQGDQTITVTQAIVLQGGSAGAGSGVSLNASGGQAVTAGSLSLKGGASGSNNSANVGISDGVNQTQTVNAGSITMTGGSGGSDNWAGMHTNGKGDTQNITTGTMTLDGGAGGTGNWVHVWTGDTANTTRTPDATIHQNIKASVIKATGGVQNDVAVGGLGVQTVTATSLALQGGSGGNSSATATFNSSAGQSITLDDTLTLTAGTGGVGTVASVLTQGEQTISAAKAINLTGGASGSDSVASIRSFSNQSINTGALNLQGGDGERNTARVVMTGPASNATQKITATSISLKGGNSATGATASLVVEGTGLVQDITTGSLTLTGGSGGNDNGARINGGIAATSTVTQKITAGAITLTGGAATGSEANNNAIIQSNGAQAIKASSMTLNGGAGGTFSRAGVGTIVDGAAQTVEISGALTLTGGNGATNNANVYSGGSQTLSATEIGIVGGNQGSDNSAGIYRNSDSPTVSADQVISANKIALTGGGGLQNQAGIFQDGAGKQTIVIKGGGALTLQGGSGDALPATGRTFEYCNGCKLSSNGAMIINSGSSQVVDFVSGGTLNLTGGTRGSDNAALLIGNMDNGGTQTITSSGGAANYPVITLTGGSGGYYNPGDGANAGNVAALGAFDGGTPSASAGGLKTIHAKSITLNGGGTANERGGALLATGNGGGIVNVTGDLVMNGGGSSLALLNPANPTTAYWPDAGSLAGITARGNVDLKVGGNLIMRGGTGNSSPAGILLTNGGKLTANVAGATRIDAGASSAGVVTGVTGSDTLPQPGSAGITLGTADSVTTSTFASSSKYFTLEGAINVIGSAPDAQLVGSYTGGAINGPGWRALGAKPLVAEVYASDGIEVGDHAAINTPHGSWIAVLGKNAAASVGASENTLTYNALASHGYQWTTAAYNAGNAQDFRFILPDNSPVVEVHADAAISQAACTSNPALCVTPPIAAATPTSAVAPVVIDVTLTGGVDETPLSASLAQNQADTPPPAVAPAPKVQGPRVAVREREAARSEQQKKSTADLKREAREAGALAKASQDAARKAALAAQKEAAEAKRLAAAAAKTEAQAVRATAAVGAAEGDLRAAEADARDARAALGAATTPALKSQAQLRLATAEAARAGAEAKLADARARRSELGAQGSEAGARSAQADAAVLDARSREAAAEAKLADLAHKEALVRAREAKDPASRAAAERAADDKRIEATQRSAESDVRQSLADDLRFASGQGKAQADARQAQAQAAQAMAQARRDEMRLQRAVARARQEEVLASGKGTAAGGAGRTAQGGKDAAEKLVAAETKRAEASQSAANAKAQAAEGKQRKADDGMAEVARRDAARRERAVKAFVAGANASMTASQLAQLAALRHEYKGVLFKDALRVLEQNGRAADLPACGGNISNTCMPSFAQARMAWPTARPLVRKPVAASLPQIERKVAIVIGINQYADQRIPQLDTAVPDADAVARQLETSMGYETRVLRNATRGEIVAALQNVSRELDPNDSLVVYYAGHGYLRAMPKGPAQGYWIPADGLASNPANWISNADVSKLLANIPAKQVMLVSDSCYSGAFSKEQKVGVAGDPSSILARRSVVVMSSGGEEPVSDEGVEGHSIFAWSLMQSMKKVGQVEPGSRVFDATREQVTAAYPQVPQYGAAVSAGHAAGGDYLFETRTYK